MWGVDLSRVALEAAWKNGGGRTAKAKPRGSDPEVDMKRKESSQGK